MSRTRSILVIVPSLIILAVFFTPWFSIEVGEYNASAIPALSREYFDDKFSIFFSYAIFLLPVLAIYLTLAHLFGQYFFLLQVKALLLFIAAITLVIIMRIEYSNIFNLHLRAGIVINFFAAFFIFLEEIIYRTRRR